MITDGHSSEAGKTMKKIFSSMSSSNFLLVFPLTKFNWKPEDKGN
jgi:hypothetical protein